MNHSSFRYLSCNTERETEWDAGVGLVGGDNHAHVQQGPADEGGTEVQEELKVDRSDAGVQLTAHEEVVGEAS